MQKALAQLTSLPLFSLLEKETAGGLIRLHTVLAEKSSALSASMIIHVRRDGEKYTHPAKHNDTQKQICVAVLAGTIIFRTSVSPGNSELASGIISSQ